MGFMISHAFKTCAVRKPMFCYRPGRFWSQTTKWSKNRHGPQRGTLNLPLHSKYAMKLWRRRTQSHKLQRSCQDIDYSSPTGRGQASEAAAAPGGGIPAPQPRLFFVVYCILSYCSVPAYVVLSCITIQFWLIRKGQQPGNLLMSWCWMCFTDSLLASQGNSGALVTFRSLEVFVELRLDVVASLCCFWSRLGFVRGVCEASGVFDTRMNGLVSRFAVTQLMISVKTCSGFCGLSCRKGSLDANESSLEASSANGHRKPRPSKTSLKPPELAAELSGGG